MDVLWIVLSGVAGLAIGSGCMVGLSKAGLNKNQQKAEQILKEAQNEAESRVKQAVLDGKTQAHDLRVEAEKEIKERKQESMELENKLLRREDNLNFRDEALNQKERQINEKMKSVADKLTSLDEKEKKLQEEIDKQVVVLESVAKMSSQAAKDELFAIVEKKMEHETIAYIKDKEDEAKATANEKAQNIIALAIERMSQQETQEKTVSVVSLPGEEMKGRIIGREGRNIRCFEQATGVELNIDDTPDLITITCFNPVRREVARLALEHLIRDGRIQPGRIEDVVKKYQNEIDQEIMKAGEEAIFKLGIGRIDREIVKLIGSDVLPDDQKLTLEIARVIRLGFLQQNAFHPDDTCVSLEKQFKMMEIILYLNQKCRSLIAMGMPMSVLRRENIFEKVISIKYDVPNDKLEMMDDYRKAVDDFYDTVMEKNG